MSFLQLWAFEIAHFLVHWRGPEQGIMLMSSIPLLLGKLESDGKPAVVGFEIALFWLHWRGSEQGALRSVT